MGKWQSGAFIGSLFHEFIQGVWSEQSVSRVSRFMF